jgi:hypothetical protein
MDKGGVCYFFIGNILVEKDTLCNGFILNRMIGSFQSLHVIWTMFFSSHVNGLMFLEDVHEDSMQISKSDQPVPMQAFGRAFEGVQTPLSG